MNDQTDAFADDVPPPPDPLAALLELVRLDITAAYTPEAVNIMATIKSENAGAYLEACKELKRANTLFSKTEMDKLVNKETANSFDLGGSAPSQTDILLRLALDGTSLFVAQRSREPFADVVIEGTRHTYHLQDDGFGDWLINCYLDTTQKAPSQDALKTVINTLAAKARRGPKLLVVPRIGYADGVVYVDRGTEDWSIFAISAAGHQLVYDCPIRFLRPTDPPGELPVPAAGGSIDELKPFLNLRDDDQFVLAVGWVLGCYMPEGDYPLELLLGPHGIGKTFIQKRQCDLADPLLDDPSSPPKNETDAMIPAQRNLIQIYDNVVAISNDQSAVYCRMSTGGRQRKRRLYSDGGEHSMRAHRPVLMNATRAVMSQEDLVDRTLTVFTAAKELGEKQKPKELITAEFVAAWPKILGAVFRAVSEGLRRLNDPLPKNLPRMADFAVWVSRCETGLGWKSGTFLAAYRKNIRESARLTAELDILASVVVSFIQARGRWEGTSTALLAELRALAGDKVAFRKEWPQSPNWLSHRLEELRPLLGRNHVDLAIRASRNGGPRSVTLVHENPEETASREGAGTPKKSPTRPAPTPPEKVVPLRPGRVETEI